MMKEGESSQSKTKKSMEGKREVGDEVRSY